MSRRNIKIHEAVHNAKTFTKTDNPDFVKTKKIWMRKGDLTCFVVHTSLKAHDSHMWYFDSKSSRHMSGDKSYFTSLEKCEGGIVTFGDGGTSRVIGKGSISVAGLPKLENALLVDGLKANLLSISQMCDSHHEVLFSKNKCEILDKKGNTVLHGVRTSDNCYGIVTTNDLTCHSAIISNID